jgi:predicted nucleic acid-binding protein
MPIADAVFVDAGLFIGALLGDDRRHAEARPLVESARRGEVSWCTSAGVLAEVYAALTWVGAQPAQPPDTAAEAVRLLVMEPSSIRVLDTGLAAALKMLDLAKRYALTGRRVHDARHAATALEAGVHGVFTYDVDDWRVFEPEGIVLAGPPSVLATP